MFRPKSRFAHERFAAVKLGVATFSLVLFAGGWVLFEATNEQSGAVGPPATLTPEPSPTSTPAPGTASPTTAATGTRPPSATPTRTPTKSKGS